MKNKIDYLKCRSIFIVVFVGFFLILASTAHATTYYSDYGISRTWNITVTAGTHHFQVNAIAANKNTEWYVNGAYTGSAENDWSGDPLWPLNPSDPDYAKNITSNTVIKAIVYDRYWSYPPEETHTWNVTIPKKNTTLSLTHSPSQPVIGQDTTITFTPNLSTGDLTSLSGLTLSVTFNGSTKSCSAGYSGKCDVPFNTPGTANTYSASASFAGTSTLNSSSATDSVQVVNPPKKNTTLSLTHSPSQPVIGQDTTITFTPNLSTGDLTSLSGLTLSVTFNGSTKSCSAGYSGKCDVPFNTPGTANTYSASASFAGTSTLNSSSGNDSVQVVNPPNGFVQVTIEPAAARTAGAQWRLTGAGSPDTGWKSSGTTISNIPVGNYTVEYNAVSGWTKPVNQIINVYQNSTTTSTGTYVQILPDQAKIIAPPVVPIGNVLPGTQQQVTVTIENTGSNARKYWIGLSFSGPNAEQWPGKGWFDIPPIQVPRATDPDLAPGGTASATFTFYLPDWMPEGQYIAHMAVWKNFNDGEKEYPDPVTGKVYTVAGLMEGELDRIEMNTFLIVPSSDTDRYALDGFDPPGGLYDNIPQRHKNAALLELPAHREQTFTLRDANENPLSASTQNLLVLFHGWQDRDAYQNGDFLALKNNLLQPGKLPVDWRLVPYGWGEDSETGFVIPDRNATNNSSTQLKIAKEESVSMVLSKDGQTVKSLGVVTTVMVVGYIAIEAAEQSIAANSTVAAYRSYMHGIVLGERLVANIGINNLKKVHIIAHSAGSWGAYATLLYLNHNVPNVEVQITYLDPFIPANILSDVQQEFSFVGIWDGGSAFNSGVLEGTPNVNTPNVFSADCYWSFSDKTFWGAVLAENLQEIIGWSFPPIVAKIESAISPKLYNSTLVNWDWVGYEGLVYRTDPSIPHTYDGHSGPVKYYADSVANPANVIFDGKAWNVALAHNYVPPPDCNDNDGDGYGSPGNAVCRNGSQADCNDSSSSINPGASEICGNGIDENCDGSDMSCPDICNDNDGDGYGSPGNAVCRNGSQADCNDSSSSINPGASDLNCNGVDEDCDGTADEHYVSSTTQCGIGVCANTGLLQCFSGNTVDSCNERIPTETPESTCDDNLDNDCDGYLDNFDSDCPIDLPWQSIIHAEGQDLGGVYQYDVTIGVDSAADTLSAPPSPPSYSVKMDLYDSNWTALSKDIRLYGETSYAWTLGIDPHGSIAPPTARTSTISWDPETFNTNLDWSYILKDGNGGVVVPDMRTTTSYDVTGGQAVQYFSIETGPETCVDMSLSAGWNLISLPVTPNDPNVAVLFPDALVAYGFNGTYQQALSLEPVKGYWIKVPSIRTYPVCGLNFINYSKTLTPGWHLMGAVNAMDVTPDTLPDGCISVMYGFNGAYYQAFDFDLKSGYWVKINEGCEFSVTAP